MSDTNGMNRTDETNGENKGENKPEEKKRPNANYRLSKTNANPRPEEITYHYDRDRRLEKAPQAVQDLYYKKQEPTRRGLFRGASQGGKFQMMLMVFILVICLVTLITVLVGRDGDTHDLDGNRITVRAVMYEDTVFILLDKLRGQARTFLNLRPARPGYAGPVSIEVSPPYMSAEQPPHESLFFQTVNFTEAPLESFFFTVPFDSEELDLVFSTGNSTLTVRVTVEGQDAY